jgi:hypothetical protein
MQQSDCVKIPPYVDDLLESTVRTIRTQRVETASNVSILPPTSILPEQAHALTQSTPLGLRADRELHFRVVAIEGAGLFPETLPIRSDRPDLVRTREVAPQYLATRHCGP